MFFFDFFDTCPQHSPCLPSLTPSPSATYYRQRSTAALILSEATAIDPHGVGYPDTPGIWSNEQIEGWKKITQAVHEAGSKILLQLWHVGRISDPLYLNGELPIAPSAIQPKGHVSLVRPLKSFVTPRALETSEIPPLIDKYRQASLNAQKAGFDGVEIHGANGYLPDQFLQSSTNTRTDCYGGPVENRARFLLEATDAAISIWGADRVGVHLAPRGDAHDMGDANPLETFGYVADELGKRKIAFICARESYDKPALSPSLKKRFGGIYIANEGFTAESAEKAIQEGTADAVAWGKDYIANPDLPKRLQKKGLLNPRRPELFYGQGPEGYTDYPTLD
jgi:2,4-dienoyl-CoA reductase-like NADH-dependent reductase (Old Yellow Enzyme family)